MKKQSIYKISSFSLWILLQFCLSYIHWNTGFLWPSDKPLWTVIALVFLFIELQTWGTGLADMCNIVMYWLIFRTNTSQVILIPNHIIWTALTHFVLLIVSGRASWTFSAYFIDLVVILIFIGIAATICLIVLV